MSVAVVEGASPTLLRTISNDITLDFALEEEHDLLRKLTYWNKRLAFAGYLRSHSDEIEAVIAFHLGLTDSGNCRLAPMGAWVHGSFNMCVPAYVKGWERCAEKRVMIRFPLPYKVGEEEVPGNAEEKLRCEAATYAWIQDNCPDVPIVRLLGFSFADDQCVITQKPFYIGISVAHGLLAVHSAGMYAMVHTISGTLPTLAPIMLLVSSTLPVHSPPPTVPSTAWLSPYGLH